MNAVILCGGKGSRLYADWPAGRPKVGVKPFEKMSGCPIVVKVCMDLIFLGATKISILISDSVELRQRELWTEYLEEELGVFVRLVAQPVWFTPWQRFLTFISDEKPSGKTLLTYGDTLVTSPSIYKEFCQHGDEQFACLTYPYEVEYGVIIKSSGFDHPRIEQKPILAVNAGHFFFRSIENQDVGGVDWDDDLEDVFINQCLANGNAATFEADFWYPINYFAKLERGET